MSFSPLASSRPQAADALPLARLYAVLVPAVRLLLGVEFVLNGLNWWVKLIDPYPSISDYAHKSPSMGVVGAMIRTGILFHLVKAIELLAGLALLSNLFVPLALVVVLPVTVNVFIVDVFLSGHVRAHIMGSGALLMSGFLMFAYLSYFTPMLDLRTHFDGAAAALKGPRQPQFHWLDPQAFRLGRLFMVVFGLASLAIGLVMVVWVLIMVAQHFHVIA